jgi:SAM-dependent methyltransferase
MLEIPPEIPPVDYIARWQAIVERRRIQMEAAYEAAGLKNVDYWGRRAKQYRAALHARTDEDPFFVRVRSAVTPRTTVLDVGAGTGRHTLALAPLAARVTAVDPSAAMLGLLREDLAASGLANVDTVQQEWLNAEVPPADIVICSHVLYPIAEVVPFVEKLQAHARERVFIYLRIDPLSTEMGLWREFYGIPLQTQPTAYDLLGVMWQMDIAPDVEVVHHPFTFHYHDIDEAQAQLRNALCLREDDAAAAARLRALLEERLVHRPDGRLGPPIESARSAIISWAGTATA